MDKKFLLVLVIFIFLTGCVEEISDEELEAELDQLSDEELDAIIKEGEIEENKVLAGKAIVRRFTSVKRFRVSLSRAATMAKRLKLRRACVYCSECEGLTKDGCNGIDFCEWINQPMGGSAKKTGTCITNFSYVRDVKQTSCCEPEIYCQELNEIKCGDDERCISIRSSGGFVGCVVRNNCNYDGIFDKGESTLTCPDYCSTLDEESCSRNLMCITVRSGQEFLRCDSLIENGVQTQIDNNILLIARDILTGRTPRDTVKTVLSATIDLCRKNPKDEDICEQESGVRGIDVQTLLERGYCCGCSDYATVFVTLARAKGLPTKYVHTLSYLSRDYFANNCARPNHVCGHKFADVLVARKQWIHVDPTGGFILEDATEDCPYYMDNVYCEGSDEPLDCKYDVLGKGIDSNDILRGKTFDEAFMQRYCCDKPLDWCGVITIENGQCIDTIDDPDCDGIAG